MGVGFRVQGQKTSATSAGLQHVNPPGNGKSSEHAHSTLVFGALISKPRPEIRSLPKSQASFVLQSLNPRTPEP